MLKKTIATAAVTLASTAAIVGTAGTADAAKTFDADKFADKYGCVSVDQQHTWIDGFTDHLVQPRWFKTTVYVLPSDKTALVRKGVNHATVSAITSYGTIRMSCVKVVPFGTRVAWS